MLVAGATALLVRRMRYEETVLAEAFPDYREYRQRVGALWPKLRVLR